MRKVNPPAPATHENHVEGTRSPAKRWGLVAAYALFIYSTLPLGLPARDFFRNSVGLENLIYAIGFACAALVVYFNLNSIRRWGAVSAIWFFTLLAVFALFISSLEQPVERLHLIEYAVMGWLSHRAARLRHDRWRSYALAALVTVSLGWLDEAIQFWIPDRVYDNRDVLLNGAGGALGLCFVHLFERGESCGGVGAR